MSPRRPGAEDGGPARGAWAPAPDGALRHHVAEHVLDAVRRGQLAPGARVHEVALARALGVSLSPVREALFRLADQNVLEHRPRRGFYVRTLGEAETREIYTFRALLEGFAARRLAERRRAAALPAVPPETPAEASAGEAALARLDALVDAGERAALAGDRQVVGDLNARFHDCLIRAAGHGLLERAWTLLAPAEWLLLPTWTWHDEALTRAEARDWAARHRRLLALVRAGDAAGAEREAGDHVRLAGEANLRRRFPHPDPAAPDRDPTPNGLLDAGGAAVPLGTAEGAAGAAAKAAPPDRAAPAEPQTHAAPGGTQERTGET